MTGRGNILGRAQGGRRWSVLAILCALVAIPAEAQERSVEVSPYIQAGQVLTADLQSGDVLTYTTVGAGIDASVQTRRVQVQLNYHYEHRFSWDEDIGDDDVHSGLARAAAQVARGVTIEGGAMATRARSDIRGDAPPVFAGEADNVSQLYAAYAGPTVETETGPAKVKAAYRFGYVKVESPGFTGVPEDQPRLDRYDDATSHLFIARVGTAAGTVAPVGMTLSGAVEREEASQLDQRYDGAYLRGDVVLPVSRSVALVAGAGYEDIEISQRDALLDEDGFPVVDGNGRFVTDPDSPRRIAYDIDGIFWDAGVVYRPNRRMMLEARIGERYGSLSYTGSLSWQMSRSSALYVGVYDSMQSFGRQLTSGLAGLPTSFETPDDPFGGQYNGCIIGDGNGVSGSCLSPIFQSIATANYRARGVDAVYAVSRGPTRFGIGAGYANRRFHVPETPGGAFSIDGLTDESYYAQAFGAYTLDPNSELHGNLYVNYFDSGIAASPDVWGTGATGAYYRSFGRLGASVSAGLYSFEQEGVDSDVLAQAMLILGYRF